MTGFNPTSINLNITFCDYDEEEKQDAKILALRGMRRVSLALNETGILRYGILASFIPNAER